VLFESRHCHAINNVTLEKLKIKNMLNPLWNEPTTNGLLQILPFLRVTN
jgi:hypothetical protein